MATPSKKGQKRPSGEQYSHENYTTRAISVDPALVGRCGRARDWGVPDKLDRRRSGVQRDEGVVAVAGGGDEELLDDGALAGDELEDGVGVGAEAAGDEG